MACVRFSAEVETVNIDYDSEEPSDGEPVVSVVNTFVHVNIVRRGRTPSSRTAPGEVLRSCLATELLDDSGEEEKNDEEEEAPERQHQPRLLGRTSPPAIAKQTEVGAAHKVTSQSHSPVLLHHETTRQGGACVRWSVDGRKLDSQDKQILSPVFELDLPGLGPQPFRLMILAKETKGKGQRGFRKAGGHSRLFIKCEASLPCETSAMSFYASVGNQELRGPYQHQFIHHNCCELQSNGEVWDLLPLVEKSSKRFEICLEMAVCTS
eukprot:TRINITY_DN7195_c0_g2_i1.p1 TRINITY_DN7195_c0_g2~~TRINITY_DN7195_c0_g2_i1.p1  ORF type:complete len:274 (-),score=56.48 TRINITY_DN7195_c0_g2_i1:188-985(-)